MKFFWIKTFLVLLLDRITKIFVINLRFPRDELVFNVFPGFNLTKVWNKGIVFGVLGDGQVGPWILVFLKSLVLIMIYIYARKMWNLSRDKVFMIGLGLIFGGGLGNLIDRIFWGAVFDFIDLHLGRYHWPSFNLADVGITIGVFIIVLKVLFSKSLKNVT